MSIELTPRAPLGRVTFDSDGAAIADRVPVGFAGGLVDHDVGLVHMQVQSMSDTYKATFLL